MNTIAQTFADGRKWTKMLAIILIVSFLLNLLSFSLATLVSNVFSSLIPGILLLTYSNSVKDIEISTGNTTIEQIETACEKQARFFKYLGILSIVAVLLIAIGFILAVVYKGNINLTQLFL